MKTIFLFFLLPSLSFASVGFRTGNDFLSTDLEGEVSVTCRDGVEHSVASFRCVGNVLDPAEFVKLQGPPALDADEVVLNALREDGSRREKSEGYDPETGLSRGHFNLWISTLFQRPLLKMGTNEITYSYRKNGIPVLGGTFRATVTQGADRICRYRRHYFSSDMNDCRSGHQICGRFFREENYCQ